MIWSGVTKIMGVKKTTNNTTTSTIEGGFVDCGVFGTTEATTQDPRCFINNFVTCTKAKLEMRGDDGTVILMTVFGLENDKCHYKMEVNGGGVDCLFNQTDLDEKLINQVFGNDEGKKEIVDNACTMF
jgi:hypothetical protein